MADLVTSRIFTDGERGITAQKLNDIVGSSVIQPAFYSSKPTAPTADPADIALILKAGAYAQVPISALAGSATQAQIWDTRLRSYNAIGNPNFEVDQRTIGAGTNVNTIFALDRWKLYKSGTLLGQAQSVSGNIVVPGTNFLITQTFLRVTVNTSQASLAAGDYYQLDQIVEGIALRELVNDVHSFSLLVRSSVAGLKFGVALRNSAVNQSLTKLCTIPSSNVWTLITLPNLPVWAGAQSLAVGTLGYYLDIVLACGSTNMNTANDAWQSTGSVGAVGQSNFFANAVNSTFDIAFVQHEPGSICTTLMDKPFSQNLDECQRYYSKSYDYGVLAGSSNAGTGVCYGTSLAGISPYLSLPFKKSMAKAPAVTGYSPNTGAINCIRDVTPGNTDRAISGPAIGPATSGFSGFNIVGPNAAPWLCALHYTADTGW